jgi:hypothetical protein
MDYAAFLDALEKTSLFELWRLNAAITRALEDPSKNEAIRAKLRVGQAIRYFEGTENREIAGVIVEIKRSRVLIRHDHDQKLWNIPFYMINLQEMVNDPPRSRVGGKVQRDSLQVGDYVSYVSRTHLDVYGIVVKLNPKTAVVQLPDGERWKVAYSLLSYVLDGEEAAAARHSALQTLLEPPLSDQAPEVTGTEGPE